MRLAWLSVVIASLLLAFAPGASAEILVLKNGTRIPCRVLKLSETEVVIRDGRGQVSIHRLDDVEEILPDASPVEIFEAVAEKHSQPGALMYYLGAYCLEHQVAYAQRAFMVAAEDPWWRGRALMGVVRSAQEGEARRRNFQEAMAADPTLAGSAGDLKELAILDVPMEVLGDLAAALETLDAVDQGDYSRVARALSDYEKKFPVEVRERASFRMKAEVGISVDEITKRVAAAARVIRRDCNRCNSSGYVACDACGGKDVFSKCNECEGHGYIVRTNRVTGGISPHRISISICNRCRGNGLIECRTCTRDTKARTREHTQKVPVICRTCSGFTRTRCRSCGGGGTIAVGSSRIRTQCRTCNGSGGLPCEACRSTGGHENRKTVRIRQTASGFRPCSSCNPRRDIAFPGSERMAEINRPGGRAREVDTVFTVEETDALRRYRRDMFAQSGAKETYAWLSGRNLPVLFAAASYEQEEEEKVFAAGRWVEPDNVRVIAQQQMALGYNPRSTSPSAFASELVRLQMRDLNASALDTGTNRDALWAIMNELARLNVAGGLDQYERMRLYKTTLPAGTLTLDAEGILRVVALEDSESWPTRQLLLSCDGAEGGASLRMISEAAESNAGGQVVIYYRIMNVNRQTSGNISAPTNTISADIRISAAAVGPAVVVEGLELLADED